MPTISQKQAVCDELRRDLPTWSGKDTEATLRSAEAFMRTFNAVCGQK